MPPQSDKENNITRGKQAQNKQSSAHGHNSKAVQPENSRDQLKHVQPKASVLPPPDVTKEDCVTVIFHALLSPDFHFNHNKQKISIRAGLEELRNWEWNCANDFTIIE